MKKNNFITAAKNLKKNFWLLFSTVATLGLFVRQSLTSLLTMFAVFVAVTVISLWDKTKPVVIHERCIRIGTIFLTLLIASIGYDTFNTTWIPSRKVAALVDVLHLSKPELLVGGAGLIGCVAGFYAMHTLSCWIVNVAIQVFGEKMPEQRKSAMVSNMKKNWYFPISAMAFFCLSATVTRGYFIGLLIAFIISMIVSSQIPSLWEFVKKNCIGIQVIAVLTAIGICWNGQTFFYENWSVSSKAKALEDMLPISIDVTNLVSVFGAVVALFFVYFWVLLFWKEMMRVITETGVFNAIKTGEIAIYAVVLLVTLGFVTISFAQTAAFYGTELSYDIIYTSDSPLVKVNGYLTLMHPENDLRQPLFAVFAAPFVSIPYLLGKLFGVSASIQAMLMNYVQIVMLFAANYVLTKMMKLTPAKRICFMLLTCCTYTHLLSVLMMEQYIVAYFWLIFCLYLICEKKPERIALWGAGGTLLPSMILLPFMSDKLSLESIKELFMNMLKYGCEFVAVMLAFSRFDVIFNLRTTVSALNKFTGRNLGMMEKIYQYTKFIRNCFVAPDAGVDFTTLDHVSWQLKTVTEIDFAGIVILILVIVSLVLNRDKRSSLFAAGWVGVSVVLLLGLGWGTKENGLILYALYFGWAFLVLLFQLVEKIENILNIKFLLPVLTIGCSIGLAVVNVPAIMEMVNFAITYFPV